MTTKNNFGKMAIGAVAATVAGAYYLYGSREGQAVRKNMSAFAVKMKGEMLEGLEKLKEVSEPKYKELLTKVKDKYAKADKTELNKVVGEISSVWGKMKKEVNNEILRRAEQIKKESGKTNSKVQVATRNIQVAKKKINATIAKAKTNMATKIASAKKAVNKVTTSNTVKRNVVKSVEVKTGSDIPVAIKVEQA